MAYTQNILKGCSPCENRTEKVTVNKPELVLDARVFTPHNKGTVLTVTKNTVSAQDYCVR
jgi:hypothetical protein